MMLLMLKCPNMVKCTKWMNRFMDVDDLILQVKCQKMQKSKLFIFPDHTNIFLLHCILNYLACELLQAA